MSPLKWWTAAFLALLCTTTTQAVGLQEKNIFPDNFFSSGIKLMQNSFLNKKEAHQDSEALMLAQEGPAEALQESATEKLQDIYQTKFKINNVTWSVIDWTVLCILIAIIIVVVLVALIFCCCLSSTQEAEEKAAVERTEQKWKDKDFEKFKKDEELKLSTLNDGNVPAADPEAQPMMEAME